MAAPASALTDRSSGGMFLETDSRQSISVSTDAILTGVLIALVRIIAVDRNSQARARLLEVVIGLGPGSGPELFVMLPFGNHIFIRHGAAAEVVTGGLLTRAGFMRGGIVCQNQGVLVLLVFEEIVNALLFHQPRDKVEIAFPILHAIVAGSEIPIQPQLVILELQIGKNLPDNVGDSLVLKDPAVRGAGQKPEPGNHLRTV